MISICLSACLFVSEPTPEELLAKKCAGLVLQLGDPAFRKREAAARDLIAIGYRAKSALEEGLKNPDIEIRDRCKKLIPIMWDKGLDDAVAAFVKNEKGKEFDDLPGWDRFRKVIGDGPAERAYYGKLLLSNRHFAACYDKPQNLADDILERWDSHSRLGNVLLDEVDLDSGSGPATMPELIWMQFLISEERILSHLRAGERSRRTAFLPSGVDLTHERRSSVKPLINDARAQIADRWREELTNPDGRRIVGKIVNEWLKSLGYRELDDVARGLKLARECRLVETLPAAEYWLGRKALPSVRTEALLCIGEMGDRRQYRVVAKHLMHNEIINNFTLQDDHWTIRNRDVALAVCLALEGVDRTLVGFEPPIPKSEQWEPNTMGFPSDAAREKAFERYAEFLRK